MKHAILTASIVHLSYLADGLCAEQKGKICLGPNLTIEGPNEWKASSVRLLVGNSPTISFPYHEPPSIVRSDLDLEKVHVVKVLAKNDIVVSWKLNFRKLGTDTVRIWRSKGYWHMDAATVAACQP